MTHPMITGPTGGTPIAGDPAVSRLEIRDFVKNKYHHTLLIRALQRMLDGKATDPLSFLGIGGIHGLPAEAWAGATPPAGKYYCAHGTELFPTWHRPYVSLLEQEIHRHANDIVVEYVRVSDYAQWEAAALDLRFPYWDWARRIEPGHPAVPAVLTSETAKIWVPTEDGNKTVERTVDNSLFYGKLSERHPRDTFPSPYDKWTTSIRYPTTNDENAKSNVPAFIENYEKYNESIRLQTYSCLMFVKTWELFSNEKEKSALAMAVSLEGIHNAMHNMIGGIVEGIASGHMANTAVAAFDPIFFLHHANVDRLLALWQAINPDVWVPTKPSSAKSGDTYVDNDQTALLPFWKSEDAFWNSERVRLYAPDLNYSYPEFKGLKAADPETAQSKIIAQVTSLYGPKDMIRGTLWSLLIVFNRDELGTSYLVEVYIKETFAGVVGAFANTASAECANCQNVRLTASQGIVHLNPALLEVLAGDNLPENGVVLSTLRRDLTLRVIANKPDGTPVDIPRDLPTLKAVPFSHAVGFDDRLGLPTTGKVTYHDLRVSYPWIASANFWAQRGIQVSAVE